MSEVNKYFDDHLVVVKYKVEINSDDIKCVYANIDVSNFKTKDDLKEDIIKRLETILTSSINLATDFLKENMEWTIWYKEALKELMSK